MKQKAAETNVLEKRVIERPLYKSVVVVEVDNEIFLVYLNRNSDEIINIVNKLRVCRTKVAIRYPALAMRSADMIFRTRPT